MAFLDRRRSSVGQLTRIYGFPASGVDNCCLSDATGARQGMQVATEQRIYGEVGGLTLEENENAAGCSAASSDTGA